MNAVSLWEATCKEASLGRMSHPAGIAECELDRVLLHPRFAVSQLRPDGSEKQRAVDHLSWSAGRSKADSVNGHTAPAERIKHDTLDALAIGMPVLKEKVQEVPGLIKADVDSAYRRVPIRPEHRWACGVAFRAFGQVPNLGARVGPCHLFALLRSSLRGTLHALLVQLRRFTRGNASERRFAIWRGRI